MDSPDKPLKIVEWKDAVAIAQWVAAGALQEPIHAHTVGWVVHEDENYIQLAATVAVDGEYNQSMTIPRGMVVSIKNA